MIPVDLNWIRATVLLLACVSQTGASQLAGQELKIGIIDFYGLNRVSAAQVREALTFKEGDTLSVDNGGRPAFITESETRLSMLPGVARARVSIVCCDQGRAIVFVGIEEDGAAPLYFRSAPRGTARLPPDVVQAGDQFGKALMAAVERGDAGEDDSQGHSLAHDAAMRAVQERFVDHAARDMPLLRRVLRNSADADHRALAAQVLGYVGEKQTVIDDLVYAMRDPSEDVRNNAMRALLVFAAARTSTTPVARVPYAPFIALLSSPVWSDRNKASGALMALSQDRNPELLARLRTEAMRPLVEMARWKSAGHAMAAFMILARIAGYSEQEAQAVWDRGEREEIIGAALNRRR
jgi:hypothetical protein